MIRLKNILLEKNEKPASEDPNKILVKSKKSGQSYYVGRDSFDPAKHEKVKPKTKKSKEKDSIEKSSNKQPKSSTESPSDTQPKSGNSKEEKQQEPKKLSPKEKLEKKLGSFVFLDEKERDEIADDAKNFRPDLKRKLLKFEFTSFFREYDELLDTLSIQQRNKDNEGAKETVTFMKKVAKRIQAIAIAKLSTLSTFENDPNVINSAKFYHNDSTGINHFLRTGGEIIWDKKTLADITNTPEKRLQQPIKWRMYNILVLDDHFKSDGAILQNDTIVYRGIRQNILEKFVEAGEWVDNGFVSTSLNPIIAEDFTDKQMVSGERKKRTPIFQINLKRGDRVLMLPCSEDEFCIESEITLPRGCTFKITGKDEKRNIYKVSVEYPNA